MKKIVFCFFTFMAIIACRNDNSEENIIPITNDFSQIEGEWVTVNELQNNVTDLTFYKGNRVKVLLVQNMVGRNSIYKEDEGAWTTYDDHVMNFTMWGLNIPNQEIVELNSDYMLLRNQILNSVDTYYRVVGSLEIDAGQTSSISLFMNSKVDEFKSHNPNIASIDSEGIIKGYQGGTTYLSIRSGQKLVYVKVIVKSRIDKYAEETQLLIKDIINIHGEPDMTINQITEDVDCIIYHEDLSDPAIDFLAYYYNSYGQIGNIQTIYRLIDPYNSDMSYLQDYYYKQKVTYGDNDTYGQNTFLFDNSNIVIPIYTHDPCVNYVNNKFYTERWLIDLFNKDSYIKKEPKELYMEPYTVWGGSVSDVKSYMANCEIAADIQVSEGGDYWMFYYGYDYNGNKMGYEYHFDNVDYGLNRVYVSLGRTNNYSIDDLRSHMSACGYLSAGYNSNFEGFDYYSHNILNNMYSSISVYMNKTGNPVAYYLRTFYD